MHEDDEPEEYFAPTTAGEGIQFWPWVNKVKPPEHTLFEHSILIMTLDSHDGVPRIAVRDCYADFQTLRVSQLLEYHSTTEHV